MLSRPKALYTGLRRNEGREKQFDLAVGILGIPMTKNDNPTVCPSRR